MTGLRRGEGRQEREKEIASNFCIWFDDYLQELD
ncbi:hypothetical protein BVRB_7g165860 [Beta vulgaris subsp. vulgaris]|nr:hypothetical protein BVRB_7g165860 [Beta vulgaris subsp. vulgaris]